MKLTEDYKSNIEKVKKALRIGESFDLLCRDIKIKSRNANMIFIDGFAKDDILEKIMEFFFSIDKEEYMQSAEEFTKNCVPYVEVEATDDINKIIFCVMSGMLALIVDGFDKAIIIDSRTYPQRETEDPVKDKVLQGSRDGFVETLISNTALVRRRIRDPLLTIKIFCVGSASKTDVALCYMDNKVDKKLLKKLTDSLNNAKINALTMNQQSLVETIYKYKWYNPFPKIKHSERPDSTASAILEGNIAIMVDNAPSALILPTSIFDLLDEADDYYFPPFTGTYLRLSRYLITLATLLLTPTWLLLLQNPSFIPDWLKFLELSQPSNISIFWQLILLELIIDGMRLASLNTPSFINTSLSIIGAIVLSEFAVETGWFSTEALLYMAFVFMANYSQPNFELGYTLKFLRIMLLTLTFIFNLWGYIAGLILIVLLLVTNKTISGKSYIYPIYPFNWQELKRKMFRVRITKA